MKMRWILIIFAVLVGIFFFQQILGGEVIYCCDNLLINIPSKLFLVEQLRQGVFPLWNPYIFSGSPFLADINFSLLYPLNVLYFFIPAFRALTISVMINFLIAIIGTYVFARSVNLSRFGSILSSVVFGFSGTMVVYTNNVPMLQVVSLLPWVIWSVHQYILLPSAKTLVIATSLASMQVIAGHPQLTYYTWLLTGALIVWEVTRTILVKKQGLSLWKTLKFLAVLMGLLLLVTAIQVLPFLEFVRLSTRVGRGFEYAAFDSLHPLSILRFIIPNIVGVARDGTAWARGGSVYGFTGVISLLLAAFTPKRNPYVRFFSVVTILSLLFAMGSYTVVFGLAYYLVPGIGLFRSPQHFLLLYTFGIAILAGFGLDYWRSGLSMRGTRLIRALGIIGSVAAIALLVNAHAIPSVISSFAAISGTRVVEKLHGFPAETLLVIVKLIGQNLIIVSGMLLAVAGMSKDQRPWSRITKAFFIGLIFMELFLFSRNNLLGVPHETATQWLTTAKEHSNRFPYDTEQYRVWTDPAAYPYRGKKEFGVFDWDMESAWQAEILRPNLNMIAGLPTPYGYASLVYREYQMYASSASADPTGVQLDDPTGGKVAMLTGPRLFFLDKKLQKHPVEIQSYTSNDVRLLTNRNEAGTVVFIDVNYPGWRVRVDGKESRIKTYEKVYKSVWVEKGSHEIRFTFFPQSFQVGLLMSGIGGVVSIALIFLAGQKVKKDKKHVRNGKRPHKLVDFTVVEL